MMGNDAVGNTARMRVQSDADKVRLVESFFNRCNRVYGEKQRIFLPFEETDTESKGKTLPGGYRFFKSQSTYHSIKKVPFRSVRSRSVKRSQK